MSFVLKPSSGFSTSEVITIFSILTFIPFILTYAEFTQSSEISSAVDIASLTDLATLSGSKILPFLIPSLFDRP